MMFEQAQTIDKIIRPEILKMTAYAVQPSDGLVKLDMMESPYGWPDKLKVLWLEKLKEISINRYPDASARHLKQKILNQLDLPESIGIMFGNGSDEIIQIIIQVLAHDAGPVLSVSPTFVMFRVLSKITGKQYIDVPLRDDFSLDLKAFTHAIEKHNPSCIFLAYPNNPTGTLFARNDIEDIIRCASGLVVIDEAYLTFSRKTLINWLAKYPNMLVMRTLSKAGLAGLRFGMLFADKLWLDQFNKIRLPFNINCLTQASVEFALDNLDYFEQQAQLIIDQRNHVYHQLTQLSGLDVFPSDANFILFRSNQVDATRVFERLLERHILIKCMHNPGSKLAQCLRVTIGNPQENELFLDSLENILKESV